jgi:hypothetical protein
MKLLFVGLRPSHFRHNEPVLREMARRGHQVAVLYQHPEPTVPEVIARFAADFPDRVELVAPAAIGAWRSRVLNTTREVANYAHYQLPEHPNRSLGERRLPNVHPIIARALRSRAGAWLAGRRVLLHLLLWLERRVPPSKAVREVIRAVGPDVVLTTPYIMEPVEVEYTKAAAALGIATIAFVLSWDNLTTKGTFHVRPDRVFVWNEPLAREASELHAIPRSDIVVVGCPTFDEWFELEPSRTRAELCREIGFAADRPLVTYLASSSQIAGDETTFAGDVCAALAGCADTADVGLIIRPHPLNDIWGDFHRDNAVVWPPHGELTETPQSRQDFFDALHHSIAAVGVNTSAFLEASIADCPSVTIVTPMHEHSQAGRAHFQLLVDGDFLEMESTFDGAAATIGRLARGDDAHRDQRHRFVEHFLRPNGIDRTAASVTADAIERLADQPRSRM